MIARRIWNRALATAALVAFALLLAACGGSSSTKSSSASGGASGADASPADAAVFISVNTDLSSSQWKTVNTLLAKFPGKDKTLASTRQSFETSSGLNWETDVKPALGAELDFVVLDASNTGGGVALTQPKDQGKFDALVAKANAKKAGSLVTEKVGDWTVISDKQASIDTYKTRASGKKLSDDTTFKTATGELSGDALAKVYVNGPQVQQALQARAGAAAQGTFDWAVAELVAQDDGVKLDGSVKGQPLKGVQQPAAYAPKLLGSVPSGALLVLDFKGGSSLSSLDSAAGAGVPQLQSAMGFIRQLTPIFKNETVLSVSPATPFPAVTLVAEPDNAQQAVAGIDQLVAQFGALAGGAQAQQTTIGGHSVKELNLGKFAVDYGVIDGKLVVTSSRQAIVNFGKGASINDDAAFKDAKSASGMPDQTSALMYANIKDGLSLIESLSQLSGNTIPANQSENLRPLTSFVAYGTGGSGTGKFTAFLQIK
ncbi:MAG: hypothetical protein QOG81_1576 [Gaiellaceae bacterium]|jgi:hypothetical protein|nr:hypothetical protein [Gaiellaceae bacterium]MDX6518921.1 hypothetical protein [Gaiellaceae bacterium]